MSDVRAADSEPQITVKLVQEANAAVEDGLRATFRAAIAQAGANPAAIAAVASRSIGAGALVTPEAERGGWSRYRVAMRVQGLPVTIATVELTLLA